MHSLSVVLLSLTLLQNPVFCKLLLDNKVPMFVDTFGHCQLERALLGDRVDCKAGGSAAL